MFKLPLISDNRTACMLYKRLLDFLRYRSKELDVELGHKAKMKLSLIALSALLCILSEVRGDCIWYDQCDAGRRLKCAYNGPAKPLKDTSALAKLKNFCYNLDIGSKGETCCDATSVDGMISALALLQGFFSRCPSCWRNFLTMFCEMNCSPNQQDFLKIVKTIPGPTAGSKAVTSITYNVSDTYVQAMWSSCKDVSMGGTPLKVVSVLCGLSSKCTPQKFLDSLGNNPNSPLKVSFNIIKESEINKNGKPMNGSTVPCNKPYKKGAPTCKCGDCPAAC